MNLNCLCHVSVPQLFPGFCLLHAPAWQAETWKAPTALLLVSPRPLGSLTTLCCMCILENPENTRFQPELTQGCLSDWVSHQKSCLLPWTNVGFLHSTWLGLSNRALTLTFPTGIPFTELCRGGDNAAAAAAADRNKGHTVLRNRVMQSPFSPPQVSPSRWGRVPHLFPFCHKSWCLLPF